MGTERLSGTQWVRERGCSVWVRLPRGGGCPASVPRSLWFLYVVDS